MACTDRFAALLAEMAAGQLEAEGSRRVLEHVEGCAACSQELDALAGLVGALAERVDARRAESARREWHRWAGLAAAAALLVLFGGWLASRRAASPGAEHVAALVDRRPITAPASLLRGDGAQRGAAFERGMEAYRAGDYARASRELAALHAERAGDRLVGLYLGIALLQSRDAADSERAARLFEEIQDAPGLLGERARWYLANARLAAGDVDGARRVLEALVDADGDYEPNARALLEALDAAAR